jgi:hypothetical protein
MEAFKIKNGLSATRYLGSNGTETISSVGYSLDNAVYDSKSLDASTQDTSTQGLYFKPDGTKLFILGNTNDAVYQYSLSTAWDVSTASYDSVSFSVSSQTTNTVGMTFKSDGTAMYVISGLSPDTVYQYTLSTAWDVSTASYASKSFDVSAQDTVPTDIAFKTDGTVMYIVGDTGNDINQYSLSTAWDVSTASYVQRRLLTGETSTPRGVQFKSDGTLMYIVASGTEDAIFQYTLSTAWDISTASYDSVSFSVVTQVINAYGLSLSSDGTKIYVNDNGGDVVYQYSTVAYTQTLDLATGTTFSFTPSGATTVSFTNPPASGNAIGFSVEINGDGSAITWPSSVKWHGGAAPTRYAGKDLYTFITIDGGITYYGKLAVEAAA